ncbi:hypothetical protein Leryth_016077 [Lithospermum erythrorhizon]|nr:hypothetical protein Leryth_016077 [Lithospermum erythrorhizon]
MGSSQPQLSSQGNTGLTHRVYASFCLKEPVADMNVSNWIEAYGVSDGTRSYVSSIPGLVENHVLKDFAMVSIGDFIYIIGGRICEKQRAVSRTCLGIDESEEHTAFDVEVVSTVWRYNVCSKEWSERAHLNVPRYNFACTTHDEKIYVAGGQSSIGTAKGISSAEVYDPSQDKWSALPDLNTPRYKSVGVSWKGKIYVISGFVGFCDNGYSMFVQYVERSYAEVYDETLKKWYLIPRFWQLDVPPNQIVAVGGKLFSSGDCLNSWKGHIEAYDEEINLWSKVKGSKHEIFGYGGNFDHQRLYLTMTPIGDCMFFLAGYRVQDDCSASSNHVSVIHIFDSSATQNGWRSFEPMQLEREHELCGHCCVAPT